MPLNKSQKTVVAAREGETEKPCTKCGESFPLEHFRSHQTGRLASRCNDCRSGNTKKDALYCRMCKHTRPRERFIDAAQRRLQTCDQCR